MGDVLRAEGERAEALGLYREGLEISRQVAARFGESPESLRDLFVSQAKLAAADLPDDPPAAREAAAECRRLLDENRPAGLGGLADAAGPELARGIRRADRGGGGRRGGMKDLRWRFEI